MYNDLKINNKDGGIMTLFEQVILRRNKINNKYIKRYTKRYIRKGKITIWWMLRNGEISDDFSVDEVSDLPADLIGVIYQRTVDELNDYYKGQVQLEIEMYPSGQYKGIKATIIKVEEAI